MIYTYMRVSTNKQSTERQRLLVNEYCKKNNLTIDACYEDYITGKTFNRPKYKQLKEDLKSGDTVIIASIDRLGRDWEGNKKEYKWFLENDVNLRLCDYDMLDINVEDLNNNSDLSNKLIKSMMIDVLCYGAEMERKKISERTKDALRIKKMRGEKLGRTAIHDYQEIADMYKNGKDIYEIADEIHSNFNYVRSILIDEGVYNGLVNDRREVMEAKINELYPNANKVTKDIVNDLVKHGISKSAIADHFGVSRQYVHALVKNS